jgi:hypothetical protein
MPYRYQSGARYSSDNDTLVYGSHHALAIACPLTQSSPNQSSKEGFRMSKGRDKKKVKDRTKPQKTLKEKRKEKREKSKS